MASPFARRRASHLSRRYIKLIEDGLRASVPSVENWTRSDGLEDLRQVQSLLARRSPPAGVSPRWVEDRLEECSRLFDAWERFPSTPEAYASALSDLRGGSPTADGQVFAVDLEVKAIDLGPLVAGMSPQMRALLHGSVLAGPLHGVLRGSRHGSRSSSRALVVAPGFVLEEVFAVDLQDQKLPARPFFNWDIWRLLDGPVDASSVDQELLCMLWREGTATLSLEHLVRASRALERGARARQGE